MTYNLLVHSTMPSRSTFAEMISPIPFGLLHNVQWYRDNHAIAPMLVNPVVLEFRIFRMEMYLTSIIQRNWREYRTWEKVGICIRFSVGLNITFPCSLYGFSLKKTRHVNLILGLYSANETRHYKVTPSSHWLGANQESALWEIAPLIGSAKCAISTNALYSNRFST